MHPPADRLEAVDLSAAHVVVFGVGERLLAQADAPREVLEPDERPQIERVGAFGAGRQSLGDLGIELARPGEVAGQVVEVGRYRSSGDRLALCERDGELRELGRGGGRAARGRAVHGGVELDGDHVVRTVGREGEVARALLNVVRRRGELFGALPGAAMAWRARSSATPAAGA